MKTRELSIIIFSLFISCAVFSQTVQKGYVKTKGRLNSQGEIVQGVRLDGVTILLRGNNSYLTGKNGSFSWVSPSGSYCLQKVQKKGYQLVDPDILSHCYRVSPNDLIITMETPSQRWDDKRNAERAIRDQLQRQVDSLRHELEREHDARRISDEEYERRQQAIFSQYDENVRLVNEMAETYAQIDYDMLDDFNRHVRQLILKGELQRADSLIQSKGDMNQRIDNFLRHRRANEQEADSLSRRMRQLDLSISATQHELEDIARDCYSKFDIFKLQHQFDSAAFWIVLRSDLDSLELSWTMDAHVFLGEYGFYQECIELNRRMASIAKTYYPDEIYYQVSAMNNIGDLYKELSQYDSAFLYLNCAAKLAETYLGDTSEHLAKVYNNLGVCYAEINENSNALLYYEKALSIRKRAKKDLSSYFINIGTIHHELQHYEEALAYYRNALDELMSDNIQDPDKANIATVYYNMGMTYHQLNQSDSAMYCFRLSKSLYEEIYGNLHPQTALVCLGMGSVYNYYSMYDSALVFLQQALTTDSLFYGMQHSTVTSILNNMGFSYSGLGMYDRALFNYHRALSNDLKQFGPHHLNIAERYINIGGVYSNVKEFDTAIAYYNNALGILERYGSDYQSLISVCYNNMAAIFNETKQFDKALEYVGMCLAIDTVLYGSSSSKLIEIYNTIAMTYGYQGDYDRSLAEYKTHVIPLLVTYYSEQHHKVAITYFNMCWLYKKKGEVENAIQYCQKALTIMLSIVPESHPIIAQMKEMLAELESSDE